GHALLAQEIEGAQDVVVAFDLMVDVLDAGLRRAHKRDGVMDRVDAHQGDVSDTVADAGVTDLRPEPFVAQGIGRIQADMAEAGSAGVTAHKIAATAPLSPHHQLNMIAGRVAEADEGFDFALLGFVRRTDANRVAERFKRGSRILQARLIIDLEADTLMA